MIQEILEAISKAFGSAQRPEHFTNYKHCCECAEHDETLRSHNIDTIGLEELGHPSWDPICFITIEGYLYYMPALARLALGTSEKYYLDQFLFHINSDRIAAFTAEQKVAVRRLLEFIRDTRRQEIEGYDWDFKELESRISELAK
jgi:hypothetical protein